MFARIAIVFLLVLNLGVAIWWMGRGQPEPEMPPAPQPGVPLLQLLSEADAGARAAAAAAGQGSGGNDAPLRDAGDDVPESGQEAGASGSPAVGTAPDRGGDDGADSQGRLGCYTLGPFADSAQAAAASTRLQGLALDVQLREQADDSRGWRVGMPPQSTRAAAEAVTARLREAGFDDYYIHADGPQANGIALGLFRGADAARQHAARLVEAGFKVSAEPVAGMQTWLDLSADAGLDPAAVSAVAGGLAPQPQPCGRAD